MREVGMMFNREMVLGLGRAARREKFGKFETRRTCKLPKWSTMDWGDVEESTSIEGGIQTICANTGCFADIKPKAQPGDWIYAKETYAPCLHGRIAYRADEPEPEGESRIKWHSAMLMPKRYARYWMRCTEVRAERLLDITEEGATREGIFADPFWKFSQESKISCSSPRDAYLALFDSINGDGAAEANPWVWVYRWEEVEQRG